MGLVTSLKVKITCQYFWNRTAVGINSNTRVEINSTMGTTIICKKIIPGLISEIVKKTQGWY